MKTEQPASWSIVIHGGAGLIRPNSLSQERATQCTEVMTAILGAAGDALRGGLSAVDVVQQAVMALEDAPEFNAGRGSVLDHHGAVVMDAALMCGKQRTAGAVTGIRRTRHPIEVARHVMDHTAHVLLTDGDALAAQCGLEQCDPSWFITEERRLQWQHVRDADGFQLDHGGDAPDVYGTVGAVAKDIHGHLAAATSTGGMVNKRWGRVGDSPVIGAGTYANDQTLAVSSTGHGEPYLQELVAYRVHALMELAGYTLHEATHRVIFEELPAVSGQGGLIAVDHQGRISAPFNTGGMFRGLVTSEQSPTTAIW